MSDSMRAALEKLTKKVIDLPAVSGTAIGLYKDQPCLKVLVSGKDGVHKIPSSVDGHRVVVEKAGPFKRL